MFSINLLCLFCDEVEIFGIEIKIEQKIPSFKKSQDSVDSGFVKTCDGHVIGLMMQDTCSVYSCLCKG